MSVRGNKQNNQLHGVRAHGSGCRFVKTNGTRGCTECAHTGTGIKQIGSINHAKSSRPTCNLFHLEGIIRLWQYGTRNFRTERKMFWLKQSYGIYGLLIQCVLFLHGWPSWTCICWDIGRGWGETTKRQHTLPAL